MTLRSFPYSTSPIATDQQWCDIVASWASSGVIHGYGGEGAVFGDSSGMQVKVPSLQALVNGVFYESTAQQTKTVAAAHATLDRFDRVVVRFDRNAHSVDVQVVAGTPAASPAPPALAQSSAVYDVPLGVVTVLSVSHGGGSTITAGNVSIGRFWAGPAGANTWTDIPSGLIGTIGDGGTNNFAVDARNRYRYQVVGSQCHVQFSYSIAYTTSGTNIFLQFKLPVVPKWEVNQFAGLCQNIRTVGVSVLNSGDYYVDLRKLPNSTTDAPPLTNGTSVWAFSGSYEIAQ